MHTQANASENAREFILKYLAGRQRVNSQTDIEQLYRQLRANRHGLTYDDIKNVFKELDKRKAGSLVNGRGGKPTRFIWSYSLKDVAEKALTGLYNFNTLKPLDEVSRARIINPKTRRLVRKTVSRIRSDKKTNTTQETPKIEAKQEVNIPEKTFKPIVQINLNLPENWTQKDIDALIKLLSETKN